MGSSESLTLDSARIYPVPLIPYLSLPLFSCLEDKSPPWTARLNNDREGSWADHHFALPWKGSPCRGVTLPGAAQGTACANEAPDPGFLTSQSFMTALDYLLRLLCEKGKNSRTSHLFKFLNGQYFSFLSVAAISNPKSHKEGVTDPWEGVEATGTDPAIQACVQCDRSRGH